ncbi:stage II sporulation protein D [Salipaludibacillus keqinensis]|uniref:Stage II sporulation protein D n=1 Tax=Salipaludibacillus keqinensis TaxID=2045207 RepID=A0A323TSU6_9BACI|nr:stage II sporulation protein D [Salipaludibacillus keqinensis]PYZ92515.1 stage II sporulation protein D [Salipaludibacillus keqinensis]
MVKGFMLVLLIFMVGILVIPAILVTGFSNDSPMNEQSGIMQEESGEKMTVQQEEAQGEIDTDMPLEAQSVSVFRSSSEVIEEVPMEEYIAGVVASEMPASYEMEALKAQALTARTYLIRHLLDGQDLNLPDGADVTDTVMHQVYKSDEELQMEWDGDYEWRMSRVRQAVYETEGEVITYDQEPITATFFSTSNGYTENSEEYWENEIPYLRSVESPWDMDSPRYKGGLELSVEEFEERLQVQLGEGEVGEIISRTTGGRVAEVNVGGQVFSGREVRDALELDSSDFTWQRSGNQIMVETRGWGHGVGMSQFGADGMARSGKNYRDIIGHYYHGVEIQEASTFLANLHHTGQMSYAD